MLNSTGDTLLLFVFLLRAAVLTDAMRTHAQEEFFSVYLNQAKIREQQKDCLKAAPTLDKKKHKDI